jgi:hypothetical protein
MQTCHPGQRDHPPRGRTLYGSRRGSIAGQTHVRTVLVVVARVLTDQAQQMAFAEDNHVIE